MRLRLYRRDLLNARRRGYHIGGLYEFLNYRGEEPFLILRHDVDRPVLGIKEMLAVERKLGVSSSWYYRWQTADRSLIAAATAAGSEVGLHFETLASTCKKRGITQASEIDADLISHARRALEDDVTTFRRRFDLACATIASHGDPWNRLIGIPNHQLLDDRLRERLNIACEAYDPQLLDRVDCYICDADPQINGGWTYRQTLRDALDAGHRNICFLTHPHHWSFSLRRRLHLLRRLAKQGIRHEQRIFTTQQGIKLS